MRAGGLGLRSLGEDVAVARVAMRGETGSDLAPAGVVDYFERHDLISGLDRRQPWNTLCGRFGNDPGDESGWAGGASQSRSE